MNRPLVIIESPYAGEVLLNTAYARECLRDSILRGEAPIASHLLYTQHGVLNDDNPDERALGIACGLAWSRVCDFHAFYTDRGWSRGMVQAYESIASKKNVEFRSIHGPMRFITEYYRRIEQENSQ